MFLQLWHTLLKKKKGDVKDLFFFFHKASHQLQQRLHPSNSLLLFEFYVIAIVLMINNSPNFICDHLDRAKGTEHRPA